MPRKRSIAAGFGAIGLLLGATLCGYLLFWPAALDEPPLPVPNGYDDLLSAATQIRGPVPNLRGASLEELQAFVQRNPHALERARLGLERECRVPLVRSPQYVNGALQRNQAMQWLAFLFVAEGRIAEAGGDVPGAARCYADAVRLGSRIAPGGVLIEVLTGMACEATAAEELRRVVAKLSKWDCQALMQLLDLIEAGRESRDVIERREWAVFHATETVGTRISVAISPATRRLMEQSYDKVDLSRQKADARLRLLKTRLALQMYRLDHGNYPEQLSELVPDYLPSVPLDPFGGTPLMYGLAEGEYDLWSTGYREEDEPAE